MPTTWYPSFNPSTGAIEYLRFPPAIGDPFSLHYAQLTQDAQPASIELPFSVTGIVPLSQRQQARGTTTTPIAVGPQAKQPPPGGCGQGSIWDSVLGECTDAPPDLGFIGSRVQGGSPSATIASESVIQAATLGFNATLAQIHQNQATSSAVQVAAGASQGSLDGIAAAIREALNIPISESEKAASSAFNAVTANIAVQAGTMEQLAADFQLQLEARIKRTVELIAQQGSDATTAATDSIATKLRSQEAVLEQLETKLNAHLGDLEQAVSDFAVAAADPVRNNVEQFAQALEAAVVAVQQDLAVSLDDIVEPVSEAGQAFGSDPAVLKTTLDALSAASDETAKTTLGGTKDDTIWTRLKLMGDALTAAFGKPSGPTTFADRTNLPQPSLAEAGVATFDAVWAEIYDFITGAFSTGKTSIDSLKTAFPFVAFLLGDAIELPLIAGALVLAFAEAMSPLLEEVRGSIARQAGLAKLPIGEALEAWRRGFISDTDADEDLGHQGFDAERIRVLKNLKNTLIDVSSIIEMRHRGIVSEADTRANLQDHGFITVDQDALLAASFRLIDVQTAVTAFRYGQITEQQLDSVLAENRFSPNDILVFKSVLVRPETTNAAIINDRFERLIQSGVLGRSVATDPPAGVVAAAARDGDSFANAQAAWRSAATLLPLQEWIQLGFRGHISAQELSAFMDGYRVPREWHDHFIHASQSLIPFRVIPGMLAAGAIDEERARQELRGHGFDDERVGLLLDYAAGRTKHAKSITAQNLKDLALATAREFWIQKTFTDEQYRATLLAHGYDEQMADLQIKTDTLAEHAKERTRSAAEITDEYEAGLISFDDAQTRFAQQGFSLAEIAKYLKTARAKVMVTQKTPSEADLLKLRKAAIIDDDEYKSGLRALGYPAKWVQALFELFVSGSGQETGATQ